MIVLALFFGMVTLVIFIGVIFNKGFWQGYNNSKFIDELLLMKEDQQPATESKELANE